MKKVLIVGANGSMGRRYQAILKYLGMDFIATDVQDDAEQIVKYGKTCDGLIIATPTPTHDLFIDLFQDLGRPILCEKPVTFKKDLAKLFASTDIEMMYQYHYVLKNIQADPYLVQYNEKKWAKSPGAKTRYNYYNTGKDGLYWDCMQVLGLHEGDISEVSIQNDSPHWLCTINGYELFLGLIDFGYVWAVRAWSKGQRVPRPLIFKAHQWAEMLTIENTRRFI